METGRISEGSGGSPGVLSSGSDKGKSGQFSAENHKAHRGSDNHPEPRWRGRFSARFFMDLPGSEAARLAPLGTGFFGTRNTGPARRFAPRPIGPQPPHSTPPPAPPRNTPPS